MIGLIATLGLTVALFVSDVAFTDDKIKSDAKLGALLSGLTGFVCWGLAKFYHFRDEDVVEQAHAQVWARTRRRAAVHSPDFCLSPYPEPRTRR